MKPVAARLAQDLAHHVIRPAGVAAISQALQSPHALLLGAIGIAEVFIQHAAVALPSAMHHHSKALHYLARTALEHAIRVKRAVEVELPPARKCRTR